MKTRFIKLLTVSILLIFVSISCEDLENLTSENVRERIEGYWMVSEDCTSCKSTFDAFNVYISPHPDDSTMVLIDNFGQLGWKVSARARISGRNLYINSQTLEGGWTVLGSGTISSNFKEIKWNYSMDDGSGIADQYVATYTKQ